MTSGASRVATTRGSEVDVLHGVAVHDPYRWLEDGEAPDVRAWVDRQNERTRAALDARPERSVWAARLADLMHLPVVQGIQVRRERLVLLERTAGGQQARLVVRTLTTPDADPVVLADPAADSHDHAVAIDWFFASPDGSAVAYGVSEGGTENSVLRVVDATDGGDLGEEIPNCRAASVAWESDGTGFFYTRYPEGDEYHRTVHHHTIGSAWLDDPVVWDDHPTPETWPSVRLSPDDRFLLVEAMVGWGRVDVHVLDRQTDTWSTLIGGFDVTSQFAFSSCTTLVGTTTLDAPRGRVVVVDLVGPPGDPATWTTVVGERDVVLGAPVPVGDDFLVTTTSSGMDSIERWSLDGSECRLIEGPDVVNVPMIAADREAGTACALVTGFDTPPSVWRVTDRLERIHPIWPADDIPELAVSHLEFPSTDGTMIGLFLIHRTDLEPDAATPMILNGYGGFAITEAPIWSPMIAAWCASGGAYAIAGLRGGFEHGEQWHQAGRRANKQNVFDDFHAAADWLVANRRTSRERLAIVGGSNGGLLVGAALTQRPDLCRAVWCAVPLLDMIRFPRFRIARLWTDEYGDPDVAEEFSWLWRYSPYHRVAEGERYPAVLLTTAEGDSRVDPMHARKMAAALQWAAADQDDRPVLLHQEGRAGHGAGKPVGKRAAEQADVLAFLSWQLGHHP